MTRRRSDHVLPSGPGRIQRPVLCALALAASLVAGDPSEAHDASYPIAGDSVSIQTQGDPSTWQFSFATSGQQSLALLHDPTLGATSLLVRGLGANAGRTSLIRLDQGKWAPDPQTGGYLYTDLAGTQGGVESIVLAPLGFSIFASGANWPWELAGSQDQVWVEFELGEELFCAEFDASTTTVNTAGAFTASNAAAPLACQEPVCGNGLHELGEECDDGNFDNGDGCTDQCLVAACTSVEYASTWEAIQSVVIGQTALDGYQCLFCHDSLSPPPLGFATALDLRPEVAYANLINVPAFNFFTTHDLVEPAEPSASFLYEKLAAATNGVLLPSGQLNGMPPLGLTLTSQHLEAVSKWIRGGAPETGVVEGTAELLATCLPPATPLKVERPAPPATGTGVQFDQTPWPLPSQSEDEICMTTYYDFTATSLVPEEFQVDCPGAFGVNNPSNKCFLYHGQTLLQDPQSHHSIIHIYLGDYEVDYVDAPVPPALTRQFGPFSYKRGPNAGQSCDPTVVDPASGVNPGCSGPIVTAVACTSINQPGFGVVIAFGPPDFGVNVSAPAFSGSQEPYNDQEYAAGVYSVLPMAGAIVWNSHAFNLTSQDSTMDQYLNIRFANAQDRLYPSRPIFDSDSIFSENVAPYGTQEVCRTYEIEPGARLFNLNSHTHRHGVKFRIWEPPNAACIPLGDGTGCLPGDPGQLIYQSTEYTDPVQLDFDPPVLYDSPNPEDRTFLYCSLYDNGSTPSSPDIKRQSTSPAAPENFDLVLGFIGGAGGPCGNDTVACLGGTNAGALCGGDPLACDSGVCDACPVRGGVTTEDEMFILIGSYYVPEPAQALLALAALLTISGLRRRSRGR